MGTEARLNRADDGDGGVGGEREVASVVVFEVALEVDATKTDHSGKLKSSTLSSSHALFLETGVISG